VKGTSARDMLLVIAVKAKMQYNTIVNEEER